MKKYFVFLVLLGFFSCENNDLDDRSNRPKSVSFIDLSDGEYLAIDRGIQDGGEIKPGWSNLYKYTRTEDGLLPQKIGFKDEFGTIIDSVFTMLHVEDIFPVSDEYIILSGNFTIMVDSDENQLRYYSLLVNIKDGSIYDFNGHIPGIQSYYYNRNRLQNDENGNMYYAYDYVIYKLGIDQGTMFQESYLSSSQIFGNYFFISSEANCYYRSEGQYSKAKLASEGIFILDRLYVDFFRSKGRVFAKDYNLSKIFELKILDGNCYGEEVFNLKGPYEELFYFNETDEYSYVITNPTFVTDFYYAGIIGFAFNAETKTHITLCVPIVENGEMYTILNCKDNFIWAASTSALNKKFIRLDITKFELKNPLIYEPEVELGELTSYDVIEFPSNLEVSSYNFISDEEISFKAFDLTTEKDISGIINLEGIITTTAISDKYTYEILRKLN